MSLVQLLCNANGNQTLDDAPENQSDGLVDESPWEMLERPGNYIAIFFTGLVDIFGAIGNSLLVFCLSRRKHLTSMLRILLALAVADTVLLSINFIFQCVMHAHLLFPIFGHSLQLELVAFRVWPVSMAFHSIGILLTVYICVSSHSYSSVRFAYYIPKCCHESTSLRFKQ